MFLLDQRIIYLLFQRTTPPYLGLLFLPRTFSSASLGEHCQRLFAGDGMRSVSLVSFLPTTAWHASAVWQARGNNDGERFRTSGPGALQSLQGCVPRRSTDVAFPVAQPTGLRELS